jgi:hypothetical protein
MSSSAPVTPPDTVVRGYVHSCRIHYCTTFISVHLLFSNLSCVFISVSLFFIQNINPQIIFSQIYRLYHPHSPQNQWCNTITTISRTARFVTLGCTLTVSTIIWLVIEFVMLEWREVEMETGNNTAGKEPPRGTCDYIRRVPMANLFTVH